MNNENIGDSFRLFFGLGGWLISIYDICMPILFSIKLEIKIIGQFLHSDFLYSYDILLFKWFNFRKNIDRFYPKRVSSGVL